ncbi:hypothetical protein M440DRAFT_1009483 [Trichoderma longibrachiatum ATCC 18648]|uniref:Uncharacterized protein n=1 Tax=Trichoderma longibrachiatum ATCC 18648 TaxID=983965 RepID=A0A2T4CI12_TRILO|nr:hypothetical protein M440DRAFT_1009483 [Trichoderma longibrachiatum ATCC 18648]
MPFHTLHEKSRIRIALPYHQKRAEPHHEATPGTWPCNSPYAAVGILLVSALVDRRRRMKRTKSKRNTTMKRPFSSKNGFAAQTPQTCRTYAANASMNPLHLPRRAPSSSSRQAHYSPCLMDLVNSGLSREFWKGHRNPKLVAETGGPFDSLLLAASPGRLR